VTVPDGGTLEIGATFNQCPTLDVSVAPTTGKVSQPFEVNGYASDLDSDAALSFKWVATSGSFDNATVNHTIFHCSGPGPVTITLTVSDGQCPQSDSLSIFCLGQHPPDGGEPSGAGGGGGNNGAGGNSGAGGRTGTGMGGRPGTGGVPGTGGMMTINTCALSPPQEPVSVGTNPDGGAGDPAACAQCQLDNCSFGPPPATDGCCGLADPADQVLCLTAVACFAANSATCTNAGDPSGCYCGTETSECFTNVGHPNGPCVAQVNAAAKTTEPPKIRTQFVAPDKPLGRAVNLSGCRGSFCPMECGTK